MYEDRKSFYNIDTRLILSFSVVKQKYNNNYNYNGVWMNSATLWFTQTKHYVIKQYFSNLPTYLNSTFAMAEILK
jgi:hypothetical protein